DRPVARVAALRRALGTLLAGFGSLRRHIRLRDRSLLYHGMALSRLRDQAFNTDKPYNTFVQEQIAADELWSTNMDLEGTLKLPKEKEENVNRRIGTSLFTIGSFPIEYTYYGDQFRAEWAGDAVDTVGSAFLGLTVACAR